MNVVVKSFIKMSIIIDVITFFVMVFFNNSSHSFNKVVNSGKTFQQIFDGWLAYVFLPLLILSVVFYLLCWLIQDFKKDNKDKDKC